MQQDLESQKYKKRHNSRLLAAQCLYSWLISKTPIIEAKACVLMIPALSNLEYDEDFFNDLTRRIVDSYETLDKLLGPFIKLGVESLPPVERAILWIAALELTTQPRLLSSSIIINEAVELTKDLSGQDSHKFINAVLDNFSKKLS
jgi:N utilization substance protein B